jgi:hypothetical protein
MKTKVLFMCMAICAMMTGLVSCEPINNENNPLLGVWAIEGNDTRTIEFDQENATVVYYEPSGEVFGTSQYEYIIQRKKLYFALYTEDLQLYVHECDYRTDGDNSVIVSKLNPILYYGTALNQGYDPYADVVLIKKR